MTSSNTTEPTPDSRVRAAGRPVLVVVILLVVALLVTSWLIGHRSAGAQATISVSGSATVTGHPDTMNFQIGVHTVSPASSSALDANNVKIQALINSLLKDGIKRADIQTSGLNLSQNYSPNGSPSGFAVDNTLNVTSHDLTTTGATIDRAVHAAGNGVTLNGVTLSISDEKALLALARTRAVTHARTAADQLAMAAGTHVTGVRSLSDQENPITPIFYGAMKATASANGAPSVPIEAGTQSVSVQVNVVFTMSN